MTFPLMLQIGLPAAALALGFRTSWRILRFMRWIDARREEFAAGPHWYLLNLAVRPELHGRGLGSALLQHGLNRARQQGCPCFLETANPRNVPFYQKHGLSLVYQGRPSSGGPHLWGFLALREQTR